MRLWIDRHPREMFKCFSMGFGSFGGDTREIFTVAPELVHDGSRLFTYIDVAFGAIDGHR